MGNINIESFNEVTSSASQAATKAAVGALGNTKVRIALGILAAIVIISLWDTLSNWDKAFGNVTINEVPVAGMTASEIESTLKRSYQQNLQSAQVKIFASEEAKEKDADPLSIEERLAQAEQLSVEDADAAVTSWTTDGPALGASIDYRSAAEKAVSIGREDGGVLGRLGLILFPKNINLKVDFNEDAVESLASDMDKTLGDGRRDSTVVIEEGQAKPVAGQDGHMVSRDWLEGMLSYAMMYEGANASFVAETVYAPSFISYEQAEQTSDAINKALRSGVVISYEGKDWQPDAAELGSWTQVKIAENDNKHDLVVSLDRAKATPAIVKGAGAIVKSNDVSVTFSNVDGKIMVEATGDTDVPQVDEAVEALDRELYGESGIAWSNSAGLEPARISITESGAPGTLTFEEAVDMGIITVIGEYTTEFSNYEGTENRNHNIRLASDLINNSIIKANGGTWDFNDTTGDTNQDPPFASAGSIVNGEYVDSIGGGICQVATTVFNAVYEAGLDVVTRWNHTLYIASYPAGRDASVDYPDRDFVWQNNLSSDVLLRMSYTDSTLTAQLYSVYTGRTTTTDTGPWVEGASYSTKFEYDDALAAEQYYIKTIGENGGNITVTRTVLDENGKEIGSDVFTSNYPAKDEVYVVGPGTDTSKLRHNA